MCSIKTYTFLITFSEKIFVTKSFTIDSLHEPAFMLLVFVQVHFDFKDIHGNLGVSTFFIFQFLLNCLRVNTFFTDHCNTSATTTSGRFIHIEQEKSKLREDASVWAKMSNALGSVFN